ncbi:MAG TPA: heavy metal translocating P-type ATPase, partial [Polyangiaceae bacterium]|nr:heavy metal translocating P-type ATPase [Polyangiaceae bacterium]
LLITAERCGSETRLGKLLLSVEQAQRERAPIVKLADKIAGFFVPTVLSLALVTLALWWPTGADHAIDHAVALLVVTCPCALGMATPLAVSVALQRAARGGLLFKGGEYLEALARPGYVVFDKTGTLTEGAPRLAHWQGSERLLGLVAAAERSSEHPLARAFRQAAPPTAFECQGSAETLPGRGLRARVSGHELVIGSRALLESLGFELPAPLEAALEKHALAGLTPVLIACDGKVEGLAAFGDVLREDAGRTLAALERLGHELVVLSGDDPRVVERVCRALPLAQCRGGVSPEQKLEFVSSLARRGLPVLMVGDGVNDAAAMSAASVGFAVHGGAEASLLAAHVFSTRAGVGPVLEAVLGARRTLFVIRRGILFSLAYNAAGVALAMLGVLSPLVAAIMMPLSSLTVVSSALRSGAFDAPKAKRVRT